MSTQPWLIKKIIKQSYPSRALDTSQNEIRVLHLEPGQYDERIRCTLEPVSLRTYQWTEYILRDYYHPLWSLDNDTHGTDWQPPEDSTYATADHFLAAERQHRLEPRTCSSRARVWPKRGFGSSPLDFYLTEYSDSSTSPDVGVALEKIDALTEEYLLDGRPSELNTYISGSTRLDMPSCGYVPCQCYEALSYTWGGFAEGRTIDLHGEAYTISDNLFAALKRLRKLNAVRRLWIDAICINQSDLAERAQQVRMMDMVYSRAAAVVVWLGDTQLLDPEQDLPLGEADKEAKFAQLARYNEAVADIMSHTLPIWWDRSWIVQEVVKAHYSPQVQLGAVEISWSDLKRSQLGSRLLASRPERVSVGQALEWIEAMQRGGQSSILAHLGFSSGLSCSDERGKLMMTVYQVFNTLADARTICGLDKVYSLLGMMTDQEAQSIEVDYSDTCSTTAVFIQATLAAIASQQSLKALAFVHHLRPRPSALPSWAIDFSSNITNYRGHPHPEDKLGRAWCRRQPRVEASVSRNGSILSARGLVLDTVRHVVPLTGAVKEYHRSSTTPVGKRNKGIDEIMRNKSRAFALDEQAGSEIIESLQQLPGHDPYCLLKSGKQCIDGCAGRMEWQQLRHCAEQNLYRPTDKALTESREPSLFSAWRESLSLQQRSSVNLMDERETRLPLDREDKAKEYSFFTTTCGFLGVGPRATQEGDKAVLLYGSRLPSILHEHDDGQSTFLGLGLVNGVSYGELHNVLPDIELKEMVFHLK